MKNKNKRVRFMNILSKIIAVISFIHAILIAIYWRTTPISGICMSVALGLLFLVVQYTEG